MSANNKLEQLKREVREKEMKECTFKPATNVTDKSTRNLTTFYNDQLTFCQKKQDKIEEMRAIL